MSIDKINCILIKYKFSFNKEIKHTSYIYQKVFRSLYGYHQNVTKNNNKIYIYFRKGILSDIPYIKAYKNAIILPKNFEDKIINYFNTGENPAHRWKTKGDWIVNYTIDEIDVDYESIISSLINYINDYKIINKDNEKVKLKNEIKNFSFNNLNKDYNIYLLSICNKIVSFDWFKKVYEYSEELKLFYNNYLRIKNNY
jgi:hypothetical protein